jgi:hypothetical protein
MRFAPPSKSVDRLSTCCDCLFDPEGGIAGAGGLEGSGRGIWQELVRRGEPNATRDGEYSAHFHFSKAAFAQLIVLMCR